MIFGSMLSFLTILLVGYIYAVKKRGLRLEIVIGARMESRL